LGQVAKPINHEGHEVARRKPSKLAFVTHSWVDCFSATEANCTEGGCHPSQVREVTLPQLNPARCELYEGQVQKGAKGTLAEGFALCEFVPVAHGNKTAAHR
jgi:hypothetical protein